MFKKIYGNDLSLKYYGTDYGGWAIEPSIIDKNDIVYSFGVGTDISFDIELIQKHNVLVNAFDPTPRSIAWIKNQKLPNNFIFREIGISNFDGMANFNFPPKPEYVSFSETTSSDNIISLQVKTLKSIMKELNHTKIDILKMDIEGSEYGVLEHMIDNKIFPKIILVEFHHDKNENILLEKIKLKYSIYKKNSSRDYYLFKK